jgi:MHS family proline/betaine transporter-like MFS transporter
VYVYSQLYYYNKLAKKDTDKIKLNSICALSNIKKPFEITIYQFFKVTLCNGKKMQQEQRLNTLETDKVVKANKKPGLYYIFAVILCGTALEHYDIGLFSYMLAVLSEVFFPREQEIDGLVFLTSLMPLGVLIRPIGAIVIGKIGDSWGRIHALSISMIGMALCTGSISLIPSYQQIGLLAPIILISCRLLQNFFVAGEYIGGAVYILENCKPEHRGRASSIYCSATTLGPIVASIITSMIAIDPMKYWKIPFLFGFLTGIVGFIIRIKAIKLLPQTKKMQVVSTRELLSDKNNLKIILKLAGCTTYFSGCYNLSTYFLNSYVPLVSDFSKNLVLKINSCCLVVYIIALLIAGAVADRFGAKKVMKGAAVTSMILAYPAFLLLEQPSLIGIIILKATLAALCGWYIGPFHSFLFVHFKQSAKYRLISLAHALGSIWGNCMAPIAFNVWKKYHIVTMPAILFIITSIVAFLSLNSVIGITSEDKQSS